MADHICLMLTEAESTSALIRVLSLAAAAVDLHKLTVLYVAGQWAELAQAGHLERRDRELKGVYTGPRWWTCFAIFNTLADRYGYLPTLPAYEPEHPSAHRRRLCGR